MQYRRSQKEIISYLFVLQCVGGLVSIMFMDPMLTFMCRMADYYALYTTAHYTLLYTFHCYIHEKFIYILHTSILKGKHRQCPHRYHLHVPVLPRHHQMNRSYHQNCHHYHRQHGRRTRVLCPKGLPMLIFFCTGLHYVT
jgi:hypothetical protein